MTEWTTPKLVLASKSPRREKLLKQLGLKFKVVPSEISEDFNDRKPPDQIVEGLAALKAESVGRSEADSLIIAADTLVCYQDKILEQPATEQEAVEMLTLLSGNTHDVYTGVCLLLTGPEGRILKKCVFSERTKVTFASLTSEEIRRYVDSGKPFDKAGAYGIQDDWGSLFVSRIEGDFYNVVGFPLQAFYQQMKTFEPGFFREMRIQHDT